MLIRTLSVDAFKMTMAEQIVSYPPEVSEKVGQYCIEHSVSLPGYFKEHKEYAEQNVASPDRMVSTLQAQFFVWLASDRKARKILEIGCFSGYSALAWAEGQKDLEDAEVVTLESDPLMIAIANDEIMKAEQSSHIRIIEGDALETLSNLHSPFDIIFIDADKKDYIEYYDMIMERNLLAKDGIIVADNVLAKGCTVDSSAGEHPSDSAVKNGAELRKFNDHVKADERVDVCVLPMFDGIALIKWRPNMYPLHRVQSHLSVNSFQATTARPRTVRRGSLDLHNPIRSPSRNSHDFSRTGTPSFHVHRLSDEEIEEKDEFSYGFSNRRNSHEEEDVDPFDKKWGNNQIVHPVGGYEAHNKYYD